MNPQSRRTFVATIGAAAVSLATGCGTASARRRRLDRIGLQLYTVRNEMKDDLPGTLARVAAIGYKEVEFAGYFGRRPTEIRDILARNDLTSPATHISLDSLRNEWRQTLEDVRIAGHQWVVIPWIAEEQRGGVETWKRLAAEFNAAARIARDSGLRFAYHNHDFELKELPRAGNQGAPTAPLDLLITETDPALVDFELDLYWVVKGGGDPSSYFARYGKRFPMVHVKDSAGAPEHVMTDVGSGSIDFRRIFADGEKAGIRHFFVEHDQPQEPMASIRASYAYLKAFEY